MTYYSYLQNEREDYEEFSKYYDGTFEEYLKICFELVNKYDVVYLPPYNLTDTDYNNIVIE